MTEIKIEKKKPVWPWLLLLLGIIAFVVWFFVYRNDTDENKEPLETEDNTELIDVQENNNTVADYVTFINADTNTMSLDHEFTSEAFSKLINAVEAMANEIDFDVKADIDKAKRLSEEITNDPVVTNHADKIRKAAVVVSNAMYNMQQAKYPGLSAEASDVSSAASAINPETLTLDQRDAVKSFFRKSADLLNKMN